jgi:hypothetical protein
VTRKDGPQERTLPGKMPSHETRWAPRTEALHKRAKEKLGAKADTQLVGHQDLEPPVR